MATITISGEYCSHGDIVAQLLCERLDYRHFDKNLMIGLAVQSGITVKQVNKLPDDKLRARSQVKRLFGDCAAPLSALLLAGLAPYTWLRSIVHPDPPLGELAWVEQNVELEAVR
jgi:hypothetical protein